MRHWILAICMAGPLALVADEQLVEEERAYGSFIDRLLCKPLEAIERIGSGFKESPLIDYWIRTGKAEWKDDELVISRERVVSMRYHCPGHHTLEPSTSRGRAESRVQALVGRLEKERTRGREAHERLAQFHRKYSHLRPEERGRDLSREERVQLSKDHRERSEHLKDFEVWAEESKDGSQWEVHTIVFHWEDLCCDDLQRNGELFAKEFRTELDSWKPSNEECQKLMNSLNWHLKEHATLGEPESRMIDGYEVFRSHWKDQIVLIPAK